jgi:hypothetical protein
MSDSVIGVAPLPLWVKRSPHNIVRVRVSIMKP